MKVEILNYKVFNKGALKAMFTLHILPLGIKVLNCKHFKSDKGSWFKFPDREIETGKFIPYVCFSDKANQEAIQELAVRELNNTKETDNDKVHGNTSEIPF